MRNKKFITAGAALAIIAVAIVLILAFAPQNAKPALAAEVAQKSYQAVAALGPEQKGALVRKLQVGDLMEKLQRAQNAKDLKVLTYDQFISENPIPEVDNSPDLHSLTFLQFTDTDGTTIVVGINLETQLPEFVLASSGNPHGNPRGVIEIVSGLEGGSKETSKGTEGEIPKTKKQ